MTLKGLEIPPLHFNGTPDSLEIPLVHGAFFQIALSFRLVLKVSEVQLRGPDGPLENARFGPWDTNHHAPTRICLILLEM